MADDRTLDEVFRYELEKRSTPEGIVLAALHGDRNALRGFADLACVAVENPHSENLREVREWLCFVLIDIKNGKEPNVAFGWKRRRGKPTLTQKFADFKKDGKLSAASQSLFKQWLVGQQMAGLVHAGKTQRAAAAIVARARHVSAQEALRCYRRFVSK